MNSAVFVSSDFCSLERFCSSSAAWLISCSFVVAIIWIVLVSRVLFAVCFLSLRLVAAVLLALDRGESLRPLPSAKQET